MLFTRFVFGFRKHQLPSKSCLRRLDHLKGSLQVKWQSRTMKAMLTAFIWLLSGASMVALGA